MSNMGTFEILSYDDPEQRQKWRAICDSFSNIDIFFYPEYVYLFELNGDGKAYCFIYYESPEDIVIYPFLKRRINELAVFQEMPDSLIDITSPYGYGGYLPSTQRINMIKFHRTFEKYCQDNNVVSEFIRFHPILRNDRYFISSNNNLQKWNETVVIDLEKDIDVIWRNINKYHRKKIKNSQNYGVIIHQSKDIDKFYDIYIETMKRTGASNYYFFHKEWFEFLTSLMINNFVLFNAIYNDTIIASIIFIYAGNFIHAFLGGSISENPSKGTNHLLYYTAAIWAKSHGFKYFHLGGGLRPDDTLFKFKALFSPIRGQYYIGKIVHNNGLYQYLNIQKSKRESICVREIPFFPIYRTPHN